CDGCPSIASGVKGINRTEQSFFSILRGRRVKSDAAAEPHGCRSELQTMPIVGSDRGPESIVDRVLDLVERPAHGIRSSAINLGKIFPIYEYPQVPAFGQIDRTIDRNAGHLGGSGSRAAINAREQA